MAVGTDNWCKYQFNPSELYQNPGHGNVCGQETFPGSEDYEDVTRSSTGAVQIETKTRLRETFDPYCPSHGGTTDPREPQTNSENVLTPQDTPVKTSSGTSAPQSTKVSV